MALKKIEKITTGQMDAVGVVSAPTVLTGTPAQNKAVFDRLVRDLIAPTMNDIIDNENQIVANEGARQESEVDRETAEEARAKAEEGRVTAERGRVTAEKAREEAEAQRRAVSEDVVSRANEIISAGLELVTEETDRASERAEAALDAKRGAETAEAGAVAAEGAAQKARDEAAGFAEKTAQSETLVSGAVAGAQASAQTALAAAKEASTSLAALHMRDRVYVGSAAMAADMLPGDILIINDGGAVVGGANYRDLLEEARKAAAGSANVLESMAVLSAVNATNWRQDSAGALWTTDTLAVFRAKLTAFAGAAVAGGYQDPETGRCTATWAQVQAWFITGTLKTPLQADAAGYPWRTEPPKTQMDGFSERLDAVEQMLDQTAGIFSALANGG